MNLPSLEPPPPVALTPSSRAVHDEPALWHHGIHTFLRDLDALVANGRIDLDARNVILCTLKRALPMLERAGEDLRPSDLLGAS